ncbi:MAG: GNAT family N-acetyltransferase [Bacteroidetes bacterium RIFCSPHIGHO2_02_FULL_44_7]|nr:MAG: GNAT family N-acetyltransferase [Bacteroidetes bacterium RIFCSPHIGHO2_02_FULL_44_7]
MKLHLETERLLLRELQPEDREGLFLLDSNPKVHEFLGNQPIHTREEADAIIALVRKQYAEYGIGRWAVIDKQTEEFIGWAGLKYEQKLRNFAYYDLGYRLREEYWGKGIATEAASTALKYGFSVLKLDEISAAASQANKASIAILEKIGLTFRETFVYENEVCNWYTISNIDQGDK